MQFKKLKSITLPLFKFENEKPLYVRFEGKIFEADPIKSHDGKTPATNKKPPHLAHVVNLETGEEGQIILGTVLLENLNKHYSEGAYVGRSFEIVKHPQEGGRAYCLYSLTEIEVDGKEEPAKPASKRKA